MDINSGQSPDTNKGKEVRGTEEPNKNTISSGKEYLLDVLTPTVEEGPSASVTSAPSVS
jgi:hypothetical protein